MPEPEKSPRKPRGFAGALHGLDNVVARVEAFILAWGIILMFINTVANVFGRLAGQSIYFAEELNRFLIVLITFVGLGYAARKGRHIRMSAVYDQLGDRGKKVFMILIAAFTGTVMFLLSWFSYKYLGRPSVMNRMTPALQVPVYLTYLWIPLGFFITGLQYYLTVVRNLSEEGVWISFEERDVYDETDHTPAPGI